MQFNFGFVWGPLDLSECLFFQSISTCISSGFLHLKITKLFFKYFKYININIYIYIIINIFKSYISCHTIIINGFGIKISSKCNDELKIS